MLEDEASSRKGGCSTTDSIPVEGASSLGSRASDLWLVHERTNGSASARSKAAIYFPGGKGHNHNVRYMHYQ